MFNKVCEVIGGFDREDITGSVDHIIESLTRIKAENAGRELFVSSEMVTEWGDTFIKTELYFFRDMTEEEISTKAAKAEIDKERLEKSERAKYEELRAKFGE